MSETSRYRDELVKFCEGYGIDLGYGGDPIKTSAITMDMPQPYTHIGDHPLNLGGDARNLVWFADNSLDYVYSSHLLEDFENTKELLDEWVRIVKVGGRLVLLLPDQQRYEKACAENDTEPNAAHKLKDFSLEYLKKIVAGYGHLSIVYEKDYLDHYSFALVLEKTDHHPSMDPQSIAALKSEIYNLKLDGEKKLQTIAQLEEQNSALHGDLSRIRTELESKEQRLHEMRSSLRWKIPNFFYELAKKIQA